ncbi:type II toxin-antitoxin system death-on-curing family toxin [Actinorugispora endophytica]|uniref:Death-on-curing protein n=1 Tax=Actinorugispora endophytica TaxID=1605990 RepID=A0A4V3D8E9_9ACTN|nr:type II toxin-antitoxin system death-on-curing family toxin [Actinorugispora endophytica]TDQ51487.1 death-on-curing protein [Actinorugispora endophytica]
MSVRYVTLEQALQIAAIACGAPPQVRDLGLVDSAVHRPRAQMFGEEAYPGLFEKAAALLQSLAVNHPLVDGNKRTAWLVMTVFLRKNGVRIGPTDDQAYDFVIAVCTGELSGVEEISKVLKGWV